MNKEEIEDKHYKLFCCKAADVPTGIVNHKDRPDFRIHTSDRILGIEHTRVVKPTVSGIPSEAALDSNADNIVDEAKRYYMEMGSPPAHVTLFFNLRATLKKKERASIAASVARLVRDRLPNIGQSEDLTCGLGPRNDHPIEVDQILISRWNSPKRHDWKRGDAVNIEKDVTSIFQSVIDKKSELLTSYLDECDTCWLLIVADFMKQAQGFDMDASSRSNMYTSPFERTYFLNCNKSTLFQLYTEPPQNVDP